MRFITAWYIWDMNNLNTDTHTPNYRLFLGLDRLHLLFLLLLLLCSLCALFSLSIYLVWINLPIYHKQTHARACAFFAKHQTKQQNTEIILIEKQDNNLLQAGHWSCFLFLLLLFRLRLDHRVIINKYLLLFFSSKIKRLKKKRNNS